MINRNKVNDLKTILSETRDAMLVISTQADYSENDMLLIDQVLTTNYKQIVDGIDKVKTTDKGLVIYTHLIKVHLSETISNYKINQLGHSDEVRAKIGTIMCSRDETVESIDIQFKARVRRSVREMIDKIDLLTQYIEEK